MHYVIGTRGSKLALIQAGHIRDILVAAYPEDSFEIKVIRTTGDKKQTQSLESIGSKGIFTDEIEKQLLSGEISLAVHSMKDMPGEIDERLTFAKAWDREDPRDVLILREAKSLAELPHGAVIGTGSKRRAYQLLRMRPDLTVVDIRGNVDTRIQKLMDQSQGLDGIILAAAGLKRLNREDDITSYFSVEEMIPAPTQGILAVELRKDNEELLYKLNLLASDQMEFAAQLERSFLNITGGNCHYPIGAYYDLNNTFYALFGRQDGSKIARVKKEINEDDKIQINDFVKSVFDEIKKQLDEE